MDVLLNDSVFKHTFSVQMNLSVFGGSEVREQMSRTTKTQPQIRRRLIIEP